MSIIGKHIVKEFGSPPIRILHDLNFEIWDGEFVSISGRSGSGKSTLLYLISTLDKPSSGEISIEGKSFLKMSTEEVHEFRNKMVGFIFQFHYLLEELTGIENILLGARNLGLQNKYNKRAMELLEHFGIPDKANFFPRQMSGGEQQRVAIARALLLHPKYIFADEPTGNLDTENALQVMKTLKNINREEGTTICLVTHEPDYSKMADREILLKDGRIITERSEMSL